MNANVTKALGVLAVGAGANMALDGANVQSAVEDSAVLAVVDYAGNTFLGDITSNIEALIPGDIGSVNIVGGYDVGKAIVNGIVATTAQRFLDMEGGYDDGSLSGFATQTLYNGAICLAGNYIADQF